MSRDYSAAADGFAPKPVDAAPPVRYPDDLRDLVDARLAAVTFADQPEIAGLEEAMRYSLLAGGKRIRPVLALATARALGADPADVLPYASALELIHTYSLIHDDLPAMDDDDLRRGRPTCHVVYGENVAILAGDALFAEALRLVVSEQSGEPGCVLKAIEAMLSATGASGMVGGQYIDVSGAVGELDHAGLRRLHELKTGRLIEASVTGVGLLLDVSGAVVAELARFAAEIGALFQIIDDILDVTGTDDELGKPSGSDVRHGKLTYVSMHGLARARELAAESHARAIATLNAADLPGDRADLLRIADFIHTRSN